MPGKPIALGKHAQEWMDKVIANLKPKTRIFYRQTTEHYVLPYLGERTPLKKVTAVAILDMMNRMRRAGYAEQTIAHAYTVGKTIFEQARKWRRIIFNPFDDVDPPEVKTIEPTPLTRAELLALRYASSPTPRMTRCARCRSHRGW
jgi:site-specific recombinase XerD